MVESPYANGAILSASSAGKPPGIPQYGSIDVNAVKASLVSAVEEQLKRLLAEEEENAQVGSMQPTRRYSQDVTSVQYSRAPKNVGSSITAWGRS